MKTKQAPKVPPKKEPLAKHRFNTTLGPVTCGIADRVMMAMGKQHGIHLDRQGVLNNALQNGLRSMAADRGIDTHRDWRLDE